MSKAGLTKVTGKNGRVYHKYVYCAATADEHLQDVQYHLARPDVTIERAPNVFVPGRMDGKMLSDCTNELFSRARALRAQGGVDVALNFAFGAAVMGGGAPSLRERALSFYRASYGQLARENKSVAQQVLAHHHQGELWLPGVRGSHRVQRLIDAGLHTHFRAQVHAVPLALVTAVPVSLPRAVQNGSPDQLAVA